MFIQALLKEKTDFEILIKLNTISIKSCSVNHGMIDLPPEQIYDLKMIQWFKDSVKTIFFFFKNFKSSTT